MKKAIVFDSYGTLISTGTGSVDAAQKILKKINSDMDATVFYKKWKEFHKQQMTEMKEFKKEEEIFVNDLKLLYEFYELDGDYKEDVKIMLDTLGKRKVFEETLEALAELSKKYKIYIGSTTDTEPLLKDIENNKIQVDGVYTSESLKVYKPDSKFYEQILHTIGCTPEEVVFVGDSIIDDVMGPQKVGIYSILLDRKNKYNASSEIKPDAIAKDLLEVVTIIDNL